MAPGHFGPGATSRIIGPTGNKVQPQGARGLLFGVIEQTNFGDVTDLSLSWRRSRVSGYGVHVFVVRGVMVDCGFPGAEAALRDAVATIKPRGAYITHHHEDHAGNVPALAELGIPLCMDADTEQKVMRPSSIGLYRHFIWKAARPVADPISHFADESLALISTPGHCSNHHSVWDASTGTLFSGDLFLGVKVKTAHSYEDPRVMIASLRRVLALNPDRLFCAHRGFVPNAQIMLRAKADWIENFVGQADQLIDDGLNDTEIRKKLVGKLGNSHYVSFGDYSEANFVAAVRRTRPQP